MILRHIHRDRATCYQSVINDLDLLVRLAKFTPAVIGTPPIGLAIETSDIDIACSSHDLQGFAKVATKEFGQMDDFSIRSISHLDAPATIASFVAFDWKIELFCQTIPVSRQWGYRHFVLEERLLSLEPRLKDEIIRLKRGGLKTEPAFAQALSLTGDPYEALLKLEDMPEQELLALLMLVEFP